MYMVTRPSSFTNYYCCYYSRSQTTRIDVPETCINMWVKWAVTEIGFDGLWSKENRPRAVRYNRTKNSFRFWIENELPS